MPYAPLDHAPQDLPTLEAHAALLLRHAAPSEAYVQAVLQAFQALDADADPAWTVALGLHALELLTLGWHYDPLPALFDQLQERVMAHADDATRIAFVARQASMNTLLRRDHAASDALKLLSTLVPADSPPLARAHLALALGRHHFTDRRYAESFDRAQEAIRLFQAAGQSRFLRTLWLSSGQCQHRLGRQDERLRCYQIGLQESHAVQDWRSAANLLTGIAEAQLDAGQIEDALASCRTALALIPPDAARAQVIEAEIHAVEGLALGRLGRADEGAAKMALAVQWHERNGYEWNQVRRLKEWAQLLLQSGQSDAAFQRLRQAHDLELQALRAQLHREAVSALENAEHARAVEQQAQAERHARELLVKNEALQAALSAQQLLQDELVQTRRLLTLSHLLAGIAHELGTPLGNALTALDTLQSRVGDLGLAMDQAKLSRQRLQQDVATIAAALDLGRRNLERALVLLQTYRALDAPESSQRGQAALADIVQRAWSARERAGLTLQVGDGLDLTVEAALVVQEILQQFFENVTRHAYPDGDGWVRVSAQRDAQGVHLRVQDGGCGIPPDKLDHVFDPFYSTQFGQGRSGLGLFQAQVLAMKGLRGRLRVESQLGEGSCFVLSWPGSQGGSVEA